MSLFSLVAQNIGSNLGFCNFLLLEYEKQNRCSRKKDRVVLTELLFVVISLRTKTLANEASHFLCG